MAQLHLPSVESASLQEAQRLDREGKWLEAISHCRLLAQTLEDPREKADALLTMSQNFSNLGRLGYARKSLIGVPELAVNINDARLTSYYKARYDEKMAWIADYEGNFNQEITYLHRVRFLLNLTPEDQRTEEEKKLYETSDHFLNRAHYGLARLGYNPRENIALSKSYAQASLAYYQRLRAEGRPQPHGEFFNLAYIARDAILEDNFDEAWRLIKESRSFVRQCRNWGMRAHYQLLVGEFFMGRKEPDDLSEARVRFKVAYRIRKSQARYAKGEADAAAGVALTLWLEGRRFEAFKYAGEAFKTNPLTFARTFLGG